MGLVFALQPDLRNSSPERLVLKSIKRRFALGGTLLFTALLLGVMTLAALPIFQLFWREGGFWDKAITASLAAVLVLYPLFALFCWFFEEVAVFELRSDGLYNIITYKKFLFWEGFKKHREAAGLDDLELCNWKGALNQAALDSKNLGVENRYSTKGHWILRLKNPASSQTIVIERRAKKEEIELLQAQIHEFFKRGDATLTLS